MGIVGEVLRNLFKKPFTRRYPAEKADVAENYRGKIVFFSKRCIGCRICEQNCPSHVIKVVRKGKVVFDMRACIYCGICQDVCPVDAIRLSKEFEYSTKDKRKFILR